MIKKLIKSFAYHFIRYRSAVLSVCKANENKASSCTWLALSLCCFISRLEGCISYSKQPKTTLSFINLMDFIHLMDFSSITLNW